MSRGAQAWVVFDLGFGDAGKGTITDFLVRDRGARLVVRWNGGAQAGHNVVAPDGRHHTFSQLGAGSFVPGVRTHLGPAFVLHPLALALEARQLAEKGVPDVLDRLTIDRRARLVTPFQQAAGRLRELLRGAARHGTCGVGIGEAVGDSLAGHADDLVAGDLNDDGKLRSRLARQQERKRHELAAAARELADPRAVPELQLLDDEHAARRVADAWFEAAGSFTLPDEAEASALLRDAGPLVFEGAQGILLDETLGFPPHTTWSDCTPAGALALLAGLDRPVIRLGVLRAYSTRHGEGPLPTHDPDLDAALPEPHNDGAGWQGAVRRGALDLVLLRYALEVAGGVDALAVTCLDRVSSLTAVALCHSYRAEAGAELVERDGDDRVVRLRPGERADIAHREALSRVLARARPVLESVPPQALPEVIEDALSRPVALLSSGPGASQKRWSAAWRTPASIEVSTANKSARLQSPTPRAIN